MAGLTGWAAHVQVCGSVVNKTATTNCGILRVGKKGHRAEVVAVVVEMEDEGGGGGGGGERVVAVAVERKHQRELPKWFYGCSN